MNNHDVEKSLILIFIRFSRLIMEAINKRIELHVNIQWVQNQGKPDLSFNNW